MKHLITMGSELELDARSVGDAPHSVLHSTIHINGTAHHMTLIQVYVRDDIQCTVDPGYELMLDRLTGLLSDGPWDTITIGDREYVCIIYPHAS